MMLSELITSAQEILDEYGDREVRDFETGLTFSGLFMSQDDVEKEKKAFGKAPVYIGIEDA